MIRPMVLAACVLAFGLAQAQRAPSPPSARDSAPVDLTGYWVAVVTEDWRHRMATPRRGDFESVPLNAEGRRVANEWDLARDNASGLECRAFGVGGIMRQPGRLRIDWADEDTLRIDFDAGSQSRLLHFGEIVPGSGERTWQGVSRAVWRRPPQQGDPSALIGTVDGPLAAGGGGRGQRGGPPLPGTLSAGGSIAVSTSDFRSGYLRKNGIPYSEDAVITEYIHRLPTHPNGDVWMLVVTVVEDPQFLTQPFYTSTHFRREADGSGFSPSPCRTSSPPP